ncbi:MAG: hypothetical protein NVSMB53_10090 [Gemmatimonadaceae bacterium]
MALGLKGDAMRLKAHPAESRTIPKTMYTVAIDRFAAPEVLTMHTLPVLTTGAGDVLIALDTAEVAGWDTDIRDGWPSSGKPPRFRSRSLTPTNPSL